MTLTQVARLFVVACLSAVSAFGAQDAAAPPVAARLGIHHPIERELGPGQADSFTVEMAAGQFARVVALQEGVAAVLTVSGPDGKVLLSDDSPNFGMGPEPGSWIADTTGIYQVRVSHSARSNESGRYQIELTDLDEPKDVDRRRIEAETEFFRAVGLDRAGGKDKWADALRGYERAAALWGNLKDVYEEGLCVWRMGIFYAAMGDRPKALEVFGSALKLRIEAGDRAGEARTLNAMADANWNLAEKQKALELYERALSAALRAEDRASEALILYNAGYTYSDTGNTGKALEYYGRAAALHHAAGDRRSEAADLAEMGSVYADLGQRQQALECFDKAVPLYRALGDRAGEAQVLLYMGNAYSASGEKRKALEYLGQALAVRRASSDRAGEAVALNNIGNVYRDLGENQTALEYLGQALPITRAIGDRSLESTALNNIGRVYLAVGENRKALEYLEQALSMLHALGEREGEAMALNNIGNVYSHLGENRKAAEYLDRALPLARSIGNKSREALTLNNLGLVYSNLGEKQKALEYLEQALPLWVASGDREGRAPTLNNIGLIYEGLGEGQKALTAYEQALPLYRAVGDRAGEATVLVNLAETYSKLGEGQKALAYLQQALPLSRAVGDRLGEAAALSNIAGLYSDSGQNRRALEAYGQALQLRRAIGDRTGEGYTLTNIGSVYRILGENQKALESLGQALSINRAIENRSGEAATLMSLGNVYTELGQAEKALESTNNALVLYRAVKEPAGEAGALVNIGNFYLYRGDNQKALGYYGEALAVARAVGNRQGEATTLGNMGSLYRKLGENQKALEYHEQALMLQRAVKDPDGEGLTLKNLGLDYQNLGQWEKALEYYAQSLPIRRSVGNRSGEAETLDSMASLFAARSPDAAIWFAKEAVNILQGIRHDNRGLADEIKRSYEKSIESSYRSLASLLVQRQRFGEAEEALNLLKDKEASDFVRRDGVADQLRPTALLDSERKALERYEQTVGEVVTIGQRRAALVAKRDKGQLDAAEVEEAGRLDGDLAASNRVLLTFLKQQEKDFAPDSAVAKRAGDLREEAVGVQKALQKLGPDVVAIYTLVTPNQYVAMLVTSGARKAYTTAIAEAELNRKIFEFRQLLQNPGSDPQPLAQELYRIVFPKGLREDLDAMQAKTIMWSIDSTLRYVPLAALHDGRDYLVKRFRNSLITPASLTRLTEASAPVWQGAGFGVSEAKPPFTALPSVPAELHGIFRQSEIEKGPIAGPIRLDGEFTQASFENGLRARRNNVVHIATHFDSEPGVAANSHLLLGDGTLLSLAEIEDQQDLFDGVDLLTLSACSTAFTNKSEDGREVDSFGTIAQRLGAKGVIASLWSVSDEATARLMEAMYRNHQTMPELGKSEALRRAQEEMAGGILKPGPGGESQRGVKPPVKPNAAGWTHPYYWAAFVLIGNWK